MSVFRGEDGGGQVQGFLRPIDTAEIARRLKLDETAAYRGSQGITSSGHPIARFY